MARLEMLWPSLNDRLKSDELMMAPFTRPMLIAVFAFSAYAGYAEVYLGYPIITAIAAAIGFALFVALIHSCATRLFARWADSGRVKRACANSGAVGSIVLLGGFIVGVEASSPLTRALNVHALQQSLSAEARYALVKVEYTQESRPVIRVNGHVTTYSDFDDLEKSVRELVFWYEKDAIYWNLTVDWSARIYLGYDSDVFQDD